MKGKSFLITGGSSGIGKTVAKHLASLGAYIIIVGRTKEHLQQVVSELDSDCDYIICDLTNTDQISDIFDWLKAKNIKLDGMIHCAGVEYSEPVRVQKIENTRELMAINVEAFLELEKYFIKPKLSNAGSSIVVMSSIASVACEAGMSAYAGAKAAINAAVKVSAKEFNNRKIRVNGIMPAFVDTPMTEKSYRGSGDDFKEYIDSVQPLGLIEPEQIAYLTEFLLSDKAKYITGAIIPVGGGTVI